MASNSEKTFGSRLANAQKLANHLSEFNAYSPPSTETALGNYKDLIATTTNLNEKVANMSATFSLHADARQQLFKTGDKSMIKLLPLILAYVKALLGHDAKEVDLLTALVNKMRGENGDKYKKDEHGEWVSQSQRSYGSLVVAFTSILEVLETLDATYAPSTNEIDLPKLQALGEELIASTQKVDSSYAKLKIEQNNRLQQYEKLSVTSKRVKEAVKYQYGVSSAEYKLVKGLSI